MDYGFGKTYRLENGFTALNGCIQYYKVEFTNVSLTDGADAQANYLRALEVLRTYGGQPIITKVAGKVIEFTLEQANVYGDASKKQPSEKDLIVDAQNKIKSLFANIKAVDGSTSFEVKTVEVKEVLF